MMAGLIAHGTARALVLVDAPACVRHSLDVIDACLDCRDGVVLPRDWLLMVGVVLPRRIDGS